MNPFLALAANVTALAFGVLCAFSVVRAVPALVHGQRVMFRVWMLRAVGAGAACLALAAAARRLLIA